MVTESLEGGNLDFDAWGLHEDVKVGEGANSDSAMKARVRARYALDGNTDLNPTVGFGSGKVNGEASSAFFGKLDIERRYSAATAKFGVGFGSQSIGGADAETKSLISGSLEIPF